LRQLTFEQGADSREFLMPHVSGKDGAAVGFKKAELIGASRAAGLLFRESAFAAGAF